MAPMAPLLYTVNPDLPATKLKKALERYVPRSWNVTTSGDNPTTDCKNGIPNVFGRLLNGVSAGQECTARMKPKKASGFFVHVEQWPEVRNSDSYNIWVKALLEAFKPLEA